MRICATCNQEKEYNPDQPKHSKASGFHAAQCWQCYCKAQKKRMQAHYAKNPVPEVLQDQIRANKAYDKALALEILKRKRQAELERITAKQLEQERKYAAWEARLRLQNQQRIARQDAKQAKRDQLAQCLQVSFNLTRKDNDNA